MPSIDFLQIVPCKQLATQREPWDYLGGPSALPHSSGPFLPLKLHVLFFEMSFCPLHWMSVCLFACVSDWGSCSYAEITSSVVRTGDGACADTGLEAQQATCVSCLLVNIWRCSLIDSPRSPPEFIVLLCILTWNGKKKEEMFLTASFSVRPWCVVWSAEGSTTLSALHIVFPVLRLSLNLQILFFFSCRGTSVKVSQGRAMVDQHEYSLKG